MLQPCSHALDDELRAQWRSHMCGVCLSLRDGHGQLSRTVTNTDTIMVSVLTAAQRDDRAATRRAGPCALRGMRTATVVRAEEPGVAVATAASLALATAKADDVVAEQRRGLAAPDPRKARVAAVAARSLRRRMGSAAGLDVDAVLRPLAEQADVECRGADLDALLRPTAQACAAVFAASAVAADAPDNESMLAEIGADFGRLAHLLDAIDDRAADRDAGSFNPLAATGTCDAVAVARAEALAARIEDRYGNLRLYDDRLLRVLLVDGVRRAVRLRRRTSMRCGVGGHHGVDGDGRWPDVKPDDVPENAPWPPPFPPNRRWYQRILPFTGVTCCGPALCTDHWNHCSDNYRPPACDDCCDVCDCCCSW
ncbi:DUF5685 family protein [Gordonia shandongensis]|uniref:DUF5685 family protein n=1 Tax=Gordonia shandongensis TaxID=376351 RepID=UPI001FE14A08|nr:DUF5685 family protein [Gordonia shandongensis]